MAILDKVEVTIVLRSTGQPLAEYDDPDKETSAGGKEVRKYVEAVSDEDFQFVVCLKKGFKYHGADGIDVRFYIDGDALRRSKFYERPKQYTSRQVLKEETSYTYSSATVGEGSEWSKVGFSFGAARIDEDLRVDETILHKQLACLGQIKVTVRRANLSWREQSPPKEERLQPTEVLDKKLIVKSISHTFKPGTVTRTDTPSPRTTIWTALKGRFGEPFAFNFVYRSHLALQTLGCIPSTPEPDSFAETSPLDLGKEEQTDPMIQLRAELATQRDENAKYRSEIQRLTSEAQAQAQEVQEARELKAKMAAFVGSAAAATTTPAAAPSANVKAEPIKRELTDKTSMATRAAKRPKPEYVDLD